MKTKIHYINKKTKGGYIGMNSFAARKLHVKFVKKHPEHVIEVFRKLPEIVRLHTIRHEEMESYLMKNLHFSYHHAHRNALRFEKLEKPFPKTNIKGKLKQMGFRIR